MSERQIDLLDLDINIDDPWPLYQWLRDEAPAYWDEKNQLWAVSRYEDVLGVSKDPETFWSSEGTRPGLPPDPSLINQDGEQHTRQRGLVSKGFTPRRVAQLEDHVRRIVGELLDAALPRGRMDVVADLARPLPMRIIGQMLGYPVEDNDMLLGWVDEFVKGGSGPSAVDEKVQEAFAHFAGYHSALVEQRKQLPGDDLMSVWLGAEIDGVKLDDLQLLFEHALLLVGGSETTRNVIAGGIHALLQHPEQLAWLRAHPEGLGNAMEEMLRWVTPFINMRRTALKDVTLHGKTIKKGDQVLMLYRSANRDPRAFGDPDVFDVQRKFDKLTMAFGYGKHFCLGSNLAKLELRVSLEETLRRLPDLRLDPAGTPRLGRSAFIYGLQSLPVLFGPAS